MNRDALKSAARAAVVIAVGVRVCIHGDRAAPQASIFAAFGCFATLVLVEFGGRPRERLLAHVGLAACRIAVHHVGTLCSRTSWLAAVAMAVGRVRDAVLRRLQRLLRGWNRGRDAALHPAGEHRGTELGDSETGFLGWLLATTVSTAATLLLWPARRRADLRRAAATAMRAVAELAAAPSPGDATTKAEAASRAVDGLGRSSLGSQHRCAAGPTTSTAQALAALPGETRLVALVPRGRHPNCRTLDLASPEDAQVIASSGRSARRVCLTTGRERR